LFAGGRNSSSRAGVGTLGGRPALEYILARYGTEAFNQEENCILGDDTMADRVFKKIEITGTSSKSIDEAIQNGVAKAAKTLRNLRWFEVVEIRGSVDGSNVGQWQVTMKIGFALDD
jgi:flavin-binding protein dodecin